MPLLSIKDLAVAISTRVGPAEDDPTSLYNFNSGHICTQVIGGSTDVHPILVHLCDA